MNLHSEALRIARKGTPIFPCSAEDKRPLVKEGFNAATTDEKTVSRWWGQWPDALIGMPTGAKTGCTVVDIDMGKRDSDDPALRAEGEAARQWWQDNNAQYASAMIVETRSGGLHVYCKYSGERNTQGGIHKGVDRRGEGGYVIIPPSVGYTLLYQTPKSEWPVAPANSDGSGELELMQYGMDMATMNLRDDAAEQMADVLENLLINPDEYHKNMQRMAFILAMWFGQSMPKIDAFLRGVIVAAARTGRIDMNLYRKHMARVSRMAHWYATKAEAERAENRQEMEDLKVQEERKAIKRGLRIIRTATKEELSDLKAEIAKREEELK